VERNGRSTHEKERTFSCFHSLNVSGTVLEEAELFDLSETAATKMQEGEGGSD
jgi:hypothetical protein